MTVGEKIYNARTAFLRRVALVPNIVLLNPEDYCRLLTEANARYLVIPAERAGGPHEIWGMAIYLSAYCPEPTVAYTAI